VHAEMRRPRLRKSSSEKLSCNRCVMAPRLSQAPQAPPGYLRFVLRADQKKAIPP
jgi:hypothetical protein